MFSLIMLGFPRELPGAKEMREEAMKNGILAKLDKNINGNYNCLFYSIYDSLMRTGKSRLFGAGWGRILTVWGGMGENSNCLGWRC